MKKYLPIIVIVILASILRIYALGQMPYGISNDEAGYIYNAYSIAKTGQDVNKILLPISINLDNSYSPVPVYLNVIVFSLLPMTQFSSRLVFALIGIATVFVLYLLTNKLFNNRKLSIVVSFILATSPWHIHFSRVAYDCIPALFFYLLAILIFINKIKTKNVYWSLPFLLLAFYSYHATKIFLIPLVIILSILYKQIFLSKKQIFIFFGGVMFILLSFYYVLITQNAGSRSQTLIFSDFNNIETTIRQEMNESTAPLLIERVFSNKLGYLIRVISENYLTVFSPQSLFLYGEGGLYGQNYQGLLYLVELPLLLIGMYYLIKNYPKQRLLIIGLLLASPLCATFNIDQTYATRAIMMLPFLSIIIGIGLYTLIKIINLQNKYIKPFIFIIMIGLFSISILNYLYIYYYRYSVYGRERWFGSTKDVINYTIDNSNNYDQTKIVIDGEMFILQYGIFTKADPRKIQNLWNSNYPKQLDKMYFINDCNNENTNYPKNSLNILPEKCSSEATPSSTINDKENNRVIWKIYNN